MIGVISAARRAAAPDPGGRRQRGLRARRTSGVAAAVALAGGTSSAGLRSKNPNGESRKPVYSTGMTGQSSGRTKCVTPNVCQSDDVGVGDRAVGRGPARQAVAALVLVRVVARGASLVGSYGVTQRLWPREAGAPADARVRARRASSASTSSGPACSRPAGRAGSARSAFTTFQTRLVAASHVALRRELGVEASSTAGGTRCPTGCRARRRTARRRPRTRCSSVPSTSRSRRAENRCWWCGAARPGAITFAYSGSSPGVDRHRRDDAGELHLELDVAVEVEVPVEAVLVVADGRDEADHEAARAADLVGAAVQVVVLPEDPVVLFVHADRVARRCTARPARSRARRRSSGSSPRQSQPSFSEFAMRPRPHSPASNAFFQPCIGAGVPVRARPSR